MLTVAAVKVGTVLLARRHWQVLIDPVSFELWMKEGVCWCAALSRVLKIGVCLSPSN